MTIQYTPRLGLPFPQTSDTSDVPRDVSALANAIETLMNQLIPIGALHMWTTAAPPGGWLLCNGAPISRTTYAGLFAVIGTAFGPGDGSNTFNVPDLSGRSPIGAGQGSGLTNRALGTKGGAETHTNPVPSQSVTGSIPSQSVTGNIPSESVSVTVPNHIHGLASAHAPLWAGEFGSVILLQVRDVAGSSGGAAQFSMTKNGGTQSGVSTNGVLPIEGTTDGSGAFGANGATAGGSLSGGATAGGSLSGGATAGGTSDPGNSMQPYQVINYIIRYQ